MTSPGRTSPVVRTRSMTRQSPVRPGEKYPVPKKPTLRWIRTGEITWTKLIEPCPSVRQPPDTLRWISPSNVPISRMTPAMTWYSATMSKLAQLGMQPNSPLYLLFPGPGGAFLTIIQTNHSELFCWPSSGMIPIAWTRNLRKVLTLLALARW